jgi:hypothetical protein
VSRIGFYLSDVNFVPDRLINVLDATLTITGGNRWQNPAQPLDTNDDNAVTSLDALLGINAMNARGAIALRDADMTVKGSRVYLDASGDTNHAPDDILLVINHLNRGFSLQPEAEGEAIVPESRLDIGLESTQRPLPATNRLAGESQARSNVVERPVTPPIPVAEHGDESAHAHRQSGSGNAQTEEDLLSLLADDLTRLWFTPGA